MNNIKKFYFEIINSTHRRQFIFLTILSILGMLLEVIGIGAVYPLLLNIIGFNFSEFFQQYEMLKFLGKYDQKSILFILIGFLVLIYFVKTLFFIFFYWYRAKFMRYLNAEISNDLYKKYLNQPYSFHLNRTYGNLLRNVNQTVQTFVLGYIDAILLFITQGLILIGISSILIYLQPIESFVAIFVLTSISIIYLISSKNWVINLGKIRVVYDGIKIKLIQHGLGGAKEIKISGNEKNFIKNYSFVQNEIARVTVWEDLLKVIPKVSIEFIAVFCLCIFIITLLFNLDNTSSIIPILGIYAAAGFRAIPSINGLVFAQTKLRSNAYVIEIITKDLDLEDEEIESESNVNFDINVNNIIKIKDLRYKYKNSKKFLFENFNLEIALLQSTGIVGKSGSGKTTLIDLILGLLDPLDGAITLNNKSIHKNKRNWQKNIGYVSQDIFLSDETIRENIALGEDQNEIDNSKLQYAINLSKIDEFIEDLPNGLDTKIGDRGVRLSGGQRQRIGIARAIYKNAKILVLDEATSSLDVETEKEVIKSIENLHGKLTIILISHRYSAVQNCNKIVELKNGEIIYEGSFDKYNK